MEIVILFALIGVAVIVGELRYRLVVKPAREAALQLMTVAEFVESPVDNNLVSEPARTVRFVKGYKPKSKDPAKTPALLFPGNLNPV